MVSWEIEDSYCNRSIMYNIDNVADRLNIPEYSCITSRIINNSTRIRQRINVPYKQVKFCIGGIKRYRVYSDARNRISRGIVI